MSAVHTVAFIGGAPHSGSTLLGLMLGAHPAIFYAGEAKKSVYLGDASRPLHKRVCKLCGPACAVWGGWNVRPGELYAVLAQKTGRRIVVDSTSSVAWIDRQLAQLVGGGIRRAYVLLTRDGRAVVASRRRKYPQISVRAHASTWAAHMSAHEALLQRFPGPTARLRYEDLAADPTRAIRAVSRALGIDPIAEMLAPWDTEQHPLGGNDGTQSLMRRAVSVGALGSPPPNAYYRQHPREIVLDLRWKEELSPAALAEIDEVAGAVNAAYVHEPPLRADAERLAEAGS